MTKFGPLDLLGTIGIGHDYDDLLKHTVELEVSGLRLHALDLETLIEIKKETINEKDNGGVKIIFHGICSFLVLDEDKHIIKD